MGTNSYGLGQLTNISYSDTASGGAGTTPVVSFSYDRIGRQTTITDGTGPRSFTYNDALQLATETNTLAALVRSYDQFGRATGYDLSLGGMTSVSYVRYGYDPLGRFASVSNNAGGALRATTYFYVPGSDLVQGYTNDSGFSLMRSYEPNRNLITSITNSFGGVSLHRFDYVNDAVGRRVQRADVDISSVISNLFAYNARSELEDAAMGTNTFNYRYDQIGNRRMSVISNQTSEITTYIANSLNQYSQITNNQSPITPAYDADGNLTNYNGWTFAWDAENRLVLASNATTVVSNSYDYMSRRITKAVFSSTTQQPSNSTTFIYDGWAMIYERLTSNSSHLTNSYVYGLDLSGTQQGAGTIGGILSACFNGTTAFFAYDANGNVTDLVGTNGEFLAQYQYDPYGNTISKTGALADVNPFRFSSKYTDSETGLIYYGHRYYHPEVGRWVNRDPIGEKGGVNLYEFVLDNPLNKVDYIGLNNDPPSQVYALGYLTTQGPTPKKCGSFIWVIQWLLSYAADEGGWVVQHTEVDTTATDCNGNPVTCAPTRAHFWEALGTIAKGYSMSSGAYDIWNHPGCGKCTKGTIRVYGSANFYDGMPTNVAPPGFGNCGAPCGSAPCSWMFPSLTANRVVGPAVRTLTATWNCCPNENLTSITVSP